VKPRPLKGLLRCTMLDWHPPHDWWSIVTGISYRCEFVQAADEPAQQVEAWRADRAGRLVACPVCGLTQITVKGGRICAHPRGGPHCLGSGQLPRHPTLDS
jgi:hypothetical protein